MGIQHESIQRKSDLSDMHTCATEDLHVQERPLVGLENICSGNAYEEINDKHI